MWRWKRKDPGAAVAGAPGAGTWAEEAVTPDCEVAETRKA